MPDSTVYLGLGSNVGTREEHLASALRELRELGSLTGVSTVYESDPVGYLDQGPFLNLVARLDTMLRPHRLLDRIQAIEHDAGRIRTIAQGPRTLDIDVLLYGRRVLGGEGAELDLQVPHPRMIERAFVLVPLLELDPELTDPRTGRPYAEHLHDLTAGQERAMDPTAAGLRPVLAGEELVAP